jgi:cytochrome oxidase Cu insertion factor (SCO1/SenC/PrrC family)
LAIIFVCALPIILSYFFYFFLKPQGGMSYGQLLEVKSVTHTPLRTLEGKQLTLADLRGKWLLLVIAGGKCDTRCQDRLFATRQYRAGQGVEAERIARVWVIDDESPIGAHIPAVLLQGVHIVKGSQLALDLPSLWHQSIFLIDPQGYQVMQYQLGQDHRKVMNEIGKILKNNQGLG